MTGEPISPGEEFADRKSGCDGDPTPAIGLDLDGTIDEAPVFFAALSRCWPGRVVVVTYRDDRRKALDDLDRYGVRFDDLVLVNSFAQKAEVIRDRGIGVYI